MAEVRCAARRGGRRRFLRCAAAGALGMLAAPRAGAAARAGAGARVAVVGGGFAGALAARLVREMAPAAQVTLVEARAGYALDPYSGLWLGEAAAVRGFAGAAAGVQWLRGRVTRVEERAVALADGRRLPFDWVIVAAGSGFDWGRAAAGASAMAAEQMPHAYDGDARQHAALWRRLQEMPDDGVFMIVPPPGLYKCPPAPYSRAGLAAAWLARRKPQARVLILDQKESFAQQTLFSDYWNAHYRGRIEWLSRDGGGRVEALDAARGVAITEFGEERADAINYIPPQRAADLYVASGLADDSGWCPVFASSMKSRLHARAFVIGDAAAMAPAPKSGACALGMARIAADALARELGADAAPPRQLQNICFSHISPSAAFFERATYAVDGDAASTQTHELSPRHENAARLMQTAAAAREWYKERELDGGV